MVDYYIGLLSGTSVDAIDVVLASFEQDKAQIQQQLSYPIPSRLRQKVLLLSQQHIGSIEQQAKLDQELGCLFAESVNALLAKSKIQRSAIRAIGSHGQTIRHQPTSAKPYTIQLGNPAIIAAQTKINVIANFRQNDIAHGGQGAPLIPCFHQALFGNQDVALLNIGGIANVSILLRNGETVGFDTGPGNTLLDQWYRQHNTGNYDTDARFAAEGTVNDNLLQSMLADAFFQQKPPKSTGPDYFNLSWLQQHSITSLVAADIQRSLLELTAVTISNRINHYPCQQVVLFGGGAHNPLLLERLQHLINTEITLSNEFAIDADYMEATAFAWFAKQHCDGKPLQLKQFTGARANTIAGTLYYKESN